VEVQLTLVFSQNTINAKYKVHVYKGNVKPNGSFTAVANEGR